MASNNSNPKNSHPKKKQQRVNKPGKEGGHLSKHNKRWISKNWIYFSLLVLFSVSVVYVIILDRQVVERFEGKIWQLPAKVFARPLELYVGKRISPAQLSYELKVLNYTATQKIPVEQGQYHQWNTTYEIKTREFDFWDGSEESKLFRVQISDNEITQLDDIFKNTTVSLVRFDPVYIAGIFPRHGQDRHLMKFENIPSLFFKTLILIEDRRFFEHHGVDLRAIARAFMANIKAGRTVQGGSTLTQQLVKNLFLSSDRSIIRKINEAIMSVLLELHYDKKTILETYVNEVFLGQDRERAIHGFGLASHYYFGRDLQHLSLDQMAVLVGLVKGATYYNPKRYPQRSKDRRDTILSVMAEQKLLTATQVKSHISKPLTVRGHVKRDAYPAFIDLVKRQLREFYDSDDLKSEGLRIFTTLDPYVQYSSEQAIVKVLPIIDHYKHGIQAASVVVSPGNGDVLSVVGDRRPYFDGFNRALDARRPIGSLVKPVVYLAAFQSRKFTLSSLVSDQPFQHMGEDKKLWEPLNYDKQYLDDVLLLDAFIMSRNIPTARVGLETGIDEIADTINALGFKRKLYQYPSLTLGAVDMSPFDVASIYQSLASNGFSSPLNSVLAVQNNQGELLQRYPIEVKKAADASAVSLVNFAMQQVTVEGTARRLASELDIDVAGKTGTSDDLKDSWFAGFTDDFVSVVWVGKDDNTPTGLTGSSGAMRVWSSLMSSIALRSYSPEMPSDIVIFPIDRESGLIADESCENTIQLPFIRGTEPTAKSSCISGGGSSGWFDTLFGND